MNIFMMVYDMYMMNLYIVDTICSLVSLMNMCWSTLLKYDDMCSQMLCYVKWGVGHDSCWVT